MKIHTIRRKACTCMLFFCMISMTLTPAVAASSAEQGSEAEKDPVRRELIQAAEQYAYLDPDNASPELRKKILNAREVIIYSSDGWCADGFSATVTHADGTVEEVPNFSDLFPSDWDLPVDESCTDITEDVSPVLPDTRNEFIPLTPEEFDNRNICTLFPNNININYTGVLIKMES